MASFIRINNFTLEGLLEAFLLQGICCGPLRLLLRLLLLLQGICCRPLCLLHFLLLFHGKDDPQTLNGHGKTSWRLVTVRFGTGLPLAPETQLHCAAPHDLILIRIHRRDSAESVAWLGKP